MPCSLGRLHSIPLEPQVDQITLIGVQVLAEPPTYSLIVVVARQCSSMVCLKVSTGSTRTLASVDNLTLIALHLKFKIVHRKQNDFQMAS